MDLKIALSPKNSSESKKLLEMFTNLPEISSATSNLTININEKNLDILQSCINQLKEDPNYYDNKKCKALCKNKTSCHNKAKLKGYCHRHYFIYQNKTQVIEEVI